MTTSGSPPEEDKAASIGGAPPQRLPAPLEHIWDSFARRELGRGRRDVANLIEVTLQFLLEHESRGLAPMVTTLELIHSWSDGLTKELALARRLAAQHPGALPKPHPLVAITMSRSEQGVATLVRQSAGEPATTSAQLRAFAQSLEKQLVLIHQAEAEHTAALQAKRGVLADTFRHHAALMHASANQIIAALPPLPAAGASAAEVTHDVSHQAELQPAPASRGWLDLSTARGRLRAIKWRELSPVGLIKACAQALMRGYRTPTPLEGEAVEEASGQEHPLAAPKLPAGQAPAPVSKNTLA